MDDVLRVANLNGVPTESAKVGGATYFTRSLEGAWLQNNNNLIFEIESICVKLHDELANRIFGSLDEYYKQLPLIPDFIHHAGLNSESMMSRVDFEKQLIKLSDYEYLNHSLYLYDCRKLVSSIQECSKEVVYLQGEFYRSLNFDELFFPKIEEPDGVRWITSPVVTSLHATLGFIFIRLHSLLDYTAKLVHEVEHLKRDFSTYPRLSSKNILFSGRKNLSINKEEGTIFEITDTVREVEIYRNIIIHDGLMDDMPKVYKVIEKGNTTEKFILMPDKGKEGRLEAYKNRSLFYSGEDKINIRLESLVSDFQNRLLSTLNLTHNILSARSENS